MFHWRNSLTCKLEKKGEGLFIREVRSGTLLKRSGFMRNWYRLYWSKKLLTLDPIRNFLHENFGVNFNSEAE